MQKTSFTHWRKYNNPNYLGVYSLDNPNQKIIATIESVGPEEVVRQGGAKDTKLVIHFTDHGIKPMILNVTNCQAVAMVAGSNYIEDWPGTTITIYADMAVKAKGGLTSGLRIDPYAPVVQKEELKPFSRYWQVAIDRLKSGATTLDRIKENLTLTPENETLLLEIINDSNQETQNN